MTLQAIRYKDGALSVLDQLKLPSKSTYVDIKSVNDGWNVIKTMKVRGAPAIALVGSLSVVVEIYEQEFEINQAFIDLVDKHLTYLTSARPTAVNMRKTASYLMEFLNNLSRDVASPQELKLNFISEVERLLKKDTDDNISVGNYGASHIMSNPSCTKLNGKASVLTHCNTGSLATTGYGTALGVIRSLFSQGNLDHAYCTETRPYNQGARLTAYELVYEKIPATLVADSMVSLLFKEKSVAAVVVGADRVAKNGDTANKIGTYQIAIAAKYHQIPFYIAAPFSSIDCNTESGDDIEIEIRPQEELANINGQRIAAEGICCWNPAFDVTPHQLITGGIITELGVFRSDEIANYLEKPKKL